MLSKRYTIVVSNRDTGIAREFSIRLRRLRPTLAGIGLLMCLPVLVGLGAKWSAWAEIAHLESIRSTLELENASYRAATGELTAQIASLQAVVSGLSKRSELEPADAAALEKLPTVVKSRAMGGAQSAAGEMISSVFTAPEDAFSMIRSLLTGLEGKLRLVETDLEKREELANAAPSIWPAHGWLSAGFGGRPDPFTGQADFHAGLDISTDRGRPVYATANGVVVAAAYTGAYGNLITLDHGFGLRTRYGHLSRFATRGGAEVRRGDVIGYVGATGRATGAHLHYEVWVGERPINPLRLLQAAPRGR
jgi:murein DD-endopeptidase MepM/ murein hydrolase activator NlpD